MLKFLFSVFVLAVFALAFGMQANGQTAGGDDEPMVDLKAKFDTAKGGAVKTPWAGTWKYNSRYTPVQVKFTTISATRIKFEMDAMAGANMGDIGGVASVKGNMAFYDDRQDPARSKDDAGGCQLLFTNNGSSLAVEQNENCDQYGGMGVIFEREKLLKGNPPYLEQDFSERGLFPSPAADKQFKMLVGAADYENLLNSFHLVSEGESADTDTGAKYFIGCVRGVCPYNTGIIMLDGKGKYWAAVNTDVDAETSTVHYYTNDPKWAAKMPAAIAKWAENFSSKVIYKSKK